MNENLPHEGQKCFNQTAVGEMQKEWQLAEQLRDKNKLLHLLAVTHGDRRELIYSHASTAAIRQAYPALFSIDAIIQ